MTSTDKSDTWQYVKIGAVAKAVRRVVSVEPDKEYRTMGVKWWGLGAYERETKPGHAIKASKMYAVKPGDLVINKIWVRHGSSGIVGNELNGCMVTADFPTFELDETLVLRDWLAYLFKTEWFWSECDARSRGTSGRQRIDPATYLDIEIPLPSMDEQRRIVGWIEALGKRIESAVDLQHQAKLQTQAMLVAATARLFDVELLERWPAALLDDVADIRAGVTLGRRLQPPTVNVPYLRVANVQDGYFDLEKIKEVAIRRSELDKWKLEPGDILLPEGGDWDKLGRGGVWMGQIGNCIYQNHLFRVRVDPQQFDPEFLSALIGSPYGKAYFQGVAKKTTNLATINQRDLRAFQVFCPPLSEQKRILAALQDVQIRTRALQDLQGSAHQELVALLPSVLDEAFRGDV